jgi:polysaccharide export outer membrane protein
MAILLFDVTAASAQVQPAQPMDPNLTSVSPAYTLGPGDKVRIIVYGETELSGEFFVSGNGIISFPLIGDVQAGGRTIGEVQNELTKRLGNGYLVSPRVSLEVLTYRPFFILGEVNKPGEYPYSSGLTVLAAVATAQGFTYRANTHKIFIKHAKEPSEHEYKITSDLPVLPGDTVRVVERFF